MPQVVFTQEGQFLTWHDIIGRSLRDGNVWDPHLRPFIDEAGDLGKWAIDLGANVGIFSVYLARRFGRVVAVEAHPGTYLLLVHNLELHGVTGRVQTHLCGAYNMPTMLSLHDDPMNKNPFDLDAVDFASSIQFVPALEWEPHDLVVPALPVDSLIPLNAPIGLIKCDVQGADLRALQGLQQTIRRCRPVILFEWEPDMATRHSHDFGDVVAFFEDLHYDLEGIVNSQDHVARPR